VCGYQSTHFMFPSLPLICCVITKSCHSVSDCIIQAKIIFDKSSVIVMKYSFPGPIPQRLVQFTVTAVLQSPAHSVPIDWKFI
jgi:hypothetical protein